MTGVSSILLVEDDEDDYVLARDLLFEIYGESLQLDWTQTWNEGLEEIVQGTHDLYLIDYDLGARNGIELLREIIARGCTVPVILLTGQDDRHIDLQAMKAGATDYLIKGEITAALLERAIRYAIKHHQSEEALRESEKRLRQHVVELEAAKRQYEAQGKELATLAGDLSVACDQAELANRTKSEFLANMSHELRTPLNAILGFSELMGNATLGPLGNPKYEEYTKDINDSGRHLLALIQDILDLSKIEAGKLELDEEDIDVAMTTGSCMVLVKERARNGGVKLKTDIPDGLPALHADKCKLKQILVNLLSNAVKFTPAGGEVTLKVWSRPDGGYVFQVIDTGIGIALADIPTALSPFGQVDSALSRKFAGTGLGLPLTKSLVEMHGGSLDLQSEEGAGTTVTVRFPKERIVHLPEAAQTGSPAV